MVMKGHMPPGPHSYIPTYTPWPPYPCPLAPVAIPLAMPHGLPTYAP